MVSFKLTNKSKDFSKHVVLAVFICIHQMIIRKCLLLQLSPFFWGGGGHAMYIIESVIGGHLMKVISQFPKLL